MDRIAVAAAAAAAAAASSVGGDVNFLFFGKLAKKITCLIQKKCIF